MKPYYEQDGQTIYHGDCRNILPLLPKFDAVVTDPPYGVGFSGKTTKHTTSSGGYSMIDDTPEYVDSVVVPVIKALVDSGMRVVLTPGIRSIWKYPHRVTISRIKKGLSDAT